MKVLGLEDLDFYSRNINFVIKGKHAIKTLLGGFLGCLIVAFSSMIIIQLIIFTNNNFMLNMVTKNSTYSLMTNKISLYSQLYNTIEYITLKSNMQEAPILITTNPNSIVKDFHIEHIYTQNEKYANADLLMIGFLITNIKDNTIVSLNGTNSKLFNLKVNLETYDVSLNADKTVNKFLLNKTLIDEYEITNCRKYFEDTVAMTNNSFINFNYTLYNYPYLGMFECIENLDVTYIKSFKNSVSHYTDTILSFNLELCTTEKNPDCLYDQNTLLNLLSSYNIKLFVNKRNILSKDVAHFYPAISNDYLNKKYFKQIHLELQSNYYYSVPFSLFSDGTFYSEYSTLDVFNITNSLENINERTSQVFKFSVHVVDDIKQQFYLSNKFVIDVGVTCNLIYLVYFFGNFIFQMLKQDDHHDYIMNETMTIIDPKDNENIYLEHRELMDFGNNEKKGELVVKKNEFLQYEQMALKKQDNGKSPNDVTNTSFDTQTTKKSKKNKGIVYPKQELEYKIKQKEKLIFDQINRYNINDIFRVNFGMKKSPQKVLTYNMAKGVHFINTNIANIVMNFNTFKFLINKIIFPEYQYFLVKYLSRHIIWGEYVIGFSLDYFYSRFEEKREWDIRINKVRRSLVKFRKNKKFKKYDKKILNLCKIHTQANLVDNFISELKAYYKAEE